MRQVAGAPTNMVIRTSRRAAARAPLSLRARATSASRTALLLGSALGCSIAIMAGAPGTAWAADECGADVAGVATCTPAGNPYPGGITYVGDAGENITVVLETGVNVVSSGTGVSVTGTATYNATAVLEAGSTVTAVGQGVNVSTTGGYTASIDSAATINTGSVGLIAGSSGSGYVEVTSTGDITATSTTNYVRGIQTGTGAGGYTYIDVTNDISNTTVTGTNYGILSQGGSIYIDMTGDITLENGTLNRGIWAISNSGVDIDMTGDIVSDANANVSNFGIIAIGGVGQADVNLTGNISLYDGRYSTGIYAAGSAFSGSSVTVTGDIYVESANYAANGVIMRGLGERDLTLVGDITLVSGGDYSNGVYATPAAGNTTVSITGNVDVTGVGAVFGLDIESTDDATLTVVGDVEVSAANQRSWAIDVIAGNGVGDVATLDATGDITAISTNGAAIGVFGQGTRVDIDVDGAILAQGANAIGVQVNAGADGTAVTVGDVTAYGGAAGGAGILVSSTGAAVITANGDITTTGANVEGIAAYSNTGITITAYGTISTAGANSEGVRARGYSTADVSVTATDITTTGLNSEGVYAVGNDSIDVVTTGLISTTGDDSYGVLARSFGSGDVYASVDDVTTTGANSEGVWAFGNYDVTVISTGDVTTTGDNARGLYAGSYGSGLVTIDAADVSTDGAYSHGLFANSNHGAADVSFDSVTTLAAQSDGVWVGAATGLTVNGGEITTYEDNSRGLYVYGDTAASIVDVTLAAVTTYGDGSDAIQITGDGSIDLTVTGAITTTGLDSDAVWVRSYGSATSTVVVDDVSTTGANATAVNVRAYGSGDVSVTGTGLISTTANSSWGVQLRTVEGDIYANLDEISIEGAYTVGLWAFGYSDVTLIAGDVATSGNNSNAVMAASLDEGAVSIDVGAITTDGVSSAGIDAYSTNGSVEISFDSVTTDGSLSDGVIAYAATGVSVTGGAVDVQGMGVFASTVSGDATVNLTGDVTAAGTFTAITGVYAGTGDGEVSITIVGDTVVTAPGIAIGVEAQGAADGAVVDVTGSVSATSFFNRTYGVLAMADYGLIEIDVTGDITANANADAFGVTASFNAAPPPPPPPPPSTYGLVGDGPTAAVGDPQDIDISVGGAISAVSTNGDAIGVFAWTNDGDIVVAVAAVDTTASQVASGVIASASTGNATVTTGDVSADGDSSAVAVTVYGQAGAVVTTGALQAYSANTATGLVASSADDVTATVTGAITVDGTAGATGFSVGSADGNASVTVTGDIDVDSGFAFAQGGIMFAELDATLAVTGDVDVYSLYHAEGLDVSSSAGDASLTLTGDITVDQNYAGGATAYAVDIQATLGDVFVDITGDVTVSASSAIGIVADAAAGAIDIGIDGDVTVTGVASTTGVDAEGADGVIVTHDGLITVDSEFGIGVGVFATSPLGDVSVTTGALDASGLNGAIGVNANATYGDVYVTVDGDISATSTGGNARGVTAYSFFGAVDVDITGDLIISGQFPSTGVRATGVSASVNVTGDVGVTSLSASATGLSAQAYGGEVSLVVVGDTVVTASGAATGLYAASYDEGADIDVTGSVTATSTGGDAYGVVAKATYGDIVIDVSGAITADAYDSAFGVFVTFNAPPPPPYYYYGRTETSGDTAAVGDPQNVTVTVGGLITATSETGNAHGVYVLADDNITVSTAGVTTTAMDPNGVARGLYLDSDYGDVDVTVAGDMNIDGGVGAFGIQVRAGDAVDIDVTGDVVVDGGFQAYGIIVGANGAVTIDVDGLIDVSAGGQASGIQAESETSSVVVNVVDIDVSATYSAVGVNARGETDSTVTATGQVISTGAGLSSRADTGTATISAVDITAGTQAAFSIAYAGDAIVSTTGEIISAGSGLSAWTTDGDAIVSSTGSVATTGFYGTGLWLLTTNGDAIVTNDGPVSTAGDFADGVWARSTNGEILIDSDGAVETTGDSARGIRAEAGGDISITFDEVSTFGDAVLEGSYSGEGGTFYEWASGSHGIEADSQYGAVSILGGDVFTDGDGAIGILAEGYGSVFIDVDSVETQGQALLERSGYYGDYLNPDLGAVGIDATVRGGDLTILVDTVHTAGAYAHGIVAQASAFIPSEEEPEVLVAVAAGDIYISAGIVQTLGDGARGVDALNSGGDVSVYVDGVYTFGDDAAGVMARTFAFYGEEGLVTGDALIEVDTVETHGDNSDGLFAYSRGGDATAGTGEAVTFGYGADAVAAVSADVYYNEDFASGDALAMADSATTYGDWAIAVFASAQSGDAEARVGDAYTEGDYADAIRAQSLTGDVLVTADNVVAMGDYAEGVFAQSQAGNVTVEVGNVAVYGYDADAIQALAYGGEEGFQDTEVTVTGVVSSATGTGIRANADAYSIITIEGGVVTGAYAGIVSTAGIASLIDNDGGTIYAGSGLAMQANGGFAQIDNSGEIFGRVDLTDGADTFANSGLFEAYGTSSFGSGSDLFSNSDTVGFSRSNGAASTTSFTGLESFNNTGLVSGVDGQAGDVLSMTSTTFHGGAGSQLALDVQFGGPGSIADRIVIGQATGTTTIVPNAVLAASPGTINLAGILVVDSAFATEAGGEFTMAPVDTGFVEYSLYFDADQDNWLIIGLPDATVFRLVALPGLIQDFWQRSNSAVGARFQEMRDADSSSGQASAGPGYAGGRADGWEMWMQAHGGDEGFTDMETFTIGPVVFVEDQSHNSEWKGFQFGADHRAGDLALGLTAGFVQQETHFDVGGESFDIEGWNVGGYLAWGTGHGLFANVLAKADFNSVDANLTLVPAMERFDAVSLGVSGEAGYRFGAPGAWFAEPVVALSWTSTEIDDFTVAGSNVDFGDADSLVGKAGLRFGWTVGSGDVVLTPAIGVFAIEEFEGENAMTFTNGATSFGLTDTPPDAYGKVEFGVTAETFYGLEGFVRGEWNFGSEADGGAVRLGARWRW